MKFIKTKFRPINYTAPLDRACRKINNFLNIDLFYDLSLSTIRKLYYSFYIFLFNRVTLSYFAFLVYGLMLNSNSMTCTVLMPMRR